MPEITGYDKLILSFALDESSWRGVGWGGVGAGMILCVVDIPYSGLFSSSDE